MLKLVSGRGSPGNPSGASSRLGRCKATRMCSAALGPALRSKNFQQDFHLAVGERMCWLPTTGLRTEHWRRVHLSLPPPILRQEHKQEKTRVPFPFSLLVAVEVFLKPGLSLAPSRPCPPSAQGKVALVSLLALKQSSPGCGPYKPRPGWWPLLTRRPHCTALGANA